MTPIFENVCLSIYNSKPFKVLISSALKEFHTAPSNKNSRYFLVSRVRSSITRLFSIYAFSRNNNLNTWKMFLFSNNLSSHRNSAFRCRFEIACTLLLYESRQYRPGSSDHACKFKVRKTAQMGKRTVNILQVSCSHADFFYRIPLQ